MFQALKVPETGELLTFLFYVEVFGFLKIFICVLLCLLILNQGKMPPGKIVSWKKPHRENAYSIFCFSEIPPLEINPQH